MSKLVFQGIASVARTKTGDPLFPPNGKQYHPCSHSIRDSQRAHGYFSFLFFGKCYAIVCVYFCLGKPVKLCVCLHACFLVFKAFRINTDVLAAYTLYSFKYLNACRTSHNQSVHFLCFADLRLLKLKFNPFPFLFVHVKHFLNSS